MLLAFGAEALLEEGELGLAEALDFELGLAAELAAPDGDVAFTGTVALKPETSPCAFGGLNHQSVVCTLVECYIRSENK